MHVKTLILGAGLTGLSTAYHLEKQGQTDYLLVEKEKAPGGLCKSQVLNGCTFDFSGHLLHLHTPAGKKLVKGLLGQNLRRVKRRAWIYTGSSRVPFPFQANLFALPEKERKRCLNGLLACARQTTPAPKNFKEWCLQSFGAGIYQIFMRPYNTKLWGRNPEEMTCDWCGPFVPVPTVEEALKSTVTPPKKDYGYNAYFYYPARGGCGALAEALARPITHLSLNTPVTRIDLAHKTAQCGNQSVLFEYLVNTLPLPEFLRLTGEAEFSALANKLVHTQVRVYNFAVKRAVKPFSWIYFPDKEDPFYRVGLQSGFSPDNAPQGISTFYVELPGNYPCTQQSEKRIWKALVQKGIIEESDDVLFSFWQSLPYAYAVYDKHRASAVSQALKALAGCGCLCAGRYGKWEYSFMEKSLLEGLDLAKKLV